MAEADDTVVVTARFLADGTPAYLKTDGTWSRALQEAVVARRVTTPRSSATLTGPWVSVRTS